MLEWVLILVVSVTFPAFRQEPAHMFIGEMVSQQNYTETQCMKLLSHAPGRLSRNSLGYVFGVVGRCEKVEVTDD